MHQLPRLDVPNISGKLRNVVQVSCLPWRVPVPLGIESVGQGLVVGDNVKLPAFHKVSEMLDRQVDCQ